jgi:hypothetical protein
MFLFYFRGLFITVFFSGKQFSSNFKPYSNRPFYTKACCRKSGGGYGETFSTLKVSSPRLPETPAPRTSAGRSSLIFMDFNNLLIRQNLIFQLLVHCSAIVSELSSILSENAK